MAFSSVPGRAAPGALTPGLVLFPSSGPVFRRAARAVRAVVPQASVKGRTAATPPHVPPVQSLILGSTGEPYFNWTLGAMHTSG